MKEGQRRTREGRRDTVYRVSNVTEVRQGEQWKEDTGFSPLSVGTGAEHFLRGWRGLTAAGGRMDGKEPRRQAVLLEWVLHLI